jgi:outer membrane protein, multidrug efflux system
MKRIMLYLLAFVVISGCAIGKDYKRPQIDTPEKFSVEERSAKGLIDSAWWEGFNDPDLNILIDTALKDNLDVRIAAARVEEYAGRYQATRAPIFPQAGIGAQGSRQRITENGPSPVYGMNPTYNTWNVGANANWELDIWGKLRRANEAARADILSQEYSKRAVLLSLVTAVVQGYVNLLNLDLQLIISKKTADSRKDTLKIFNDRYKGGVVSEVELNQVISEYQLALARIPQIEKAISQQENALCLLLSRNPGRIVRNTSLDKYKAPGIPSGLPSDLLERRPDVMQAEQALVAANARIGVAKAQYFPSISLTGAFGWASADLSNLFQGPSRVWNFTVPVTMPIFTAGAISGQVKAARAVREETLANYQKTIQAAFADVDDALTGYQKTKEQGDAQEKQVAALRNYRDLSYLRYENGYSDYLDVLDADSRLFDTELSYVQTRSNQVNALVTIYKAMGGGWQVAENKIETAKTSEKEAKK